MEFKFKKVRDVKSPVRGTPLSAGIDFFIPEHEALKEVWPYYGLTKENTHWTYKSYEEEIEKDDGKTGFEDRHFIKVDPLRSLLIPSGIKVQLPKGYALIAFNKSGVATKKGLIVGAEVVDEDYQGEIHIHLINTTSETVYLKPGEKIVQFILIPMVYADIIEDNNIHQVATQRGEGGFGHTGDK